MKPLYLLSVSILSFSLTSCDFLNTLFGSTQLPSTSPEKMSLTKEEMQNRCILKVHNLSQGDEKNLYGLPCIEEKRIYIQTKKEQSELIHTTDAGEHLKLEKKDKQTGKIKEVEFIPYMINKYYRVKYEIKEKQKEKHPEWLLNLLPLNEDFNGSPDKDYLILFKTLGNYLILFKASKNIEDIPYNERTAIPRNKKGEHIASEEGYYMVPFIGYKVTYCKSEVQEDTLTRRKTNIRTVNCKNITKKDKPYYVRFDASHGKELYEYMDKTNVFPANFFFKGRWFFSQGEVEQGADSTGHHYQEKAYLVEFERGEQKIGMKDVSGRLSDLNQRRSKLFKVQWKEYEMDCVSRSCGPLSEDTKNLDSFGEREDTKNTFRQKPYVQVDFTEKGDQEVSDIVITENYFSYVTSHIDKKTERRVRIKTSLLREDSIDQENFQAKRWFKDDQEHKFSLLFVSPEITEKKPGDLEEEDELRPFRLIRFNTNKKVTTIRWHFSNYTVKNDQDGEPGTSDDDDGDFYRALGKKAVELWNRAFQIITEEHCLSEGEPKDCKTIKVELAEGDKDLGDLRYNILNLVKPKVLYHSGWLGHAPSYAKADTGQIVGTTANVFIHNISSIYANYINAYIRYEIFRKKNDYEICKPEETKTRKKPELHAVTPYVRAKIEERCQEVIDFICERKGQNLKPREPLGDSQLIEKCERKVSEEVILSTILHEMGHSFGLGHNFKASLDKSNYYHPPSPESPESPEKHLEELKRYFPHAVHVSELPQSSSVMDYLPLDAPPITVIGKYDLANLRYLYLDQVESRDYQGYSPKNDKETLKKVLLKLNIEEQPENQQPLDRNTLSQMKVYESCWDTVANSTFDPLQEEDFLCIREDYGSSPKEIVEWYIKKAKRMMFNSERYAYAKSKERKNPRTKQLKSDFKFPDELLKRIIGFYEQWNLVKDAQMHSIAKADKLIAPITAEKDSRDDFSKEYSDLLQEEFCDDGSASKGECKKKIYDLYYPVREPIFNFIKETVFLRSMKCKVQNKEGHFISVDLETVKAKLLPVLGPKLEVENCESEQIQSFFKKHKMTYLGQSGLENFPSYFSQGPEKDKLDVNPIDTIVNQFIKRMKPFIIVHDPDFLYILINNIEKLFEPGENNFDKTNGLTRTDLSNAGQIIGSFMGAFYKIIKESPLELKTLNIVKLNKMYFMNERFITTIGETNSFDKLFQEPLNREESPSDVFLGRPFLQMAYEEFSNESTHNPDDRPGKTFQNYLLSRNDILPIMINRDIKSFYTPSLPNGLLQHIFKKYNQLGAEIKKLDEKKEKEGLNMWEDMYKENMVSFQSFILQINSTLYTIDNILPDYKDD